jgi:hypothetical protein
MGLKGQIDALLKRHLEHEVTGALHFEKLKNNEKFNFNKI